MNPTSLRPVPLLTALLLALAMASCNLPAGGSSPTETPPAAPPATAPTATTPAATPTAVDLDLCSLLTTEEAEPVLGVPVTASSEMGVGGCTYAPTQGFGASLVVSAAQGEDAKALVLLGLQIAMAFGGSEELVQAAQSLAEVAPDLPLWDVVRSTYGLMEELGLAVEIVDQGDGHILWSWSEGGATGTLIEVREDTYASVSVIGLDAAQTRSAAEGLLPQVFARLPTRFSVPTSTSVRIGMDESTPEAEATEEERLQGGSVWVSLMGEDRVVRLDPLSGEVLASYAVGDAPNSLAAGVQGEVYVASQLDGHVYLIEPGMGTAEPVLDVGAPELRLAADDRYLYVSACYDGKVEVFDLQAGLAPVTTLEVPGCWLAVPVGDSLWVSVGEDRLQRFAQEDWKRRTTLAVGSGPALLIPYEGYLFVAAVNQDALLRIDASEGRRAGSLHIETDGNILSMTAGEGALWVGVTEGVVRVDLQTMEVLGQVPVEDPPNGLAVGMGSLWVTHTLAGKISRYDLEALTLQESVPLGQRPWGIIFVPQP